MFTFFPEKYKNTNLSLVVVWVEVVLAGGCAAVKLEVSGSAQQTQHPMASNSSNSGDGINISTAVAIDKDKNSPHAVRWAVENLLKKNSRVFLVHVRTQVLQPRTLPTSLFQYWNSRFIDWVMDISDFYIIILNLSYILNWISI